MSIKNVLILVLVFVDKMQDVMLEIIVQSALVTVVTLEIHLIDVILFHVSY